MSTYLNLSGQSGVTGYDIYPRKIHVQFKDGGISSYSYDKAGSMHVERMKSLARLGRGLNTYINQNVKYLYD